jgi:hypothetical protein
MTGTPDFHTGGGRDAMKTVKRALIGCEILTLCFGLTALVAGCGGGGAADSSGGMSVEEQVKKTQDAKGAMDAASKEQKAGKK